MNEGSRSGGVVAPWCNALTLQLKKSGGQGLIPGRAAPQCHDKGQQTQLALSYFCDLSAWR